MQSLVARLRSVIADGVKEIWLSSEDTGAYGKRRFGSSCLVFPVPGEIAFLTRDARRGDGDLAQ